MTGGQVGEGGGSHVFCNAGLMNRREELVPIARNHPWIARLLLS